MSKYEPMEFTTATEAINMIHSLCSQVQKKARSYGKSDAAKDLLNFGSEVQTIAANLELKLSAAGVK